MSARTFSRSQLAFGGAAAALLALRFARARAALPVAIGALGGVAFLVLGLGDQPLLARYLFLPGAMLALLFAAGVTAWWVPGAPRTRVTLALTAAFAAAALASVPSTVRDVDEWVDRSEARHDADGSLASLLGRPAAGAALGRCKPPTVTYFQTRPLLAYLIHARPNQIETARPERAEGGTVVAEQRPAARLPPGFRVTERNDHWVVAEGCR